MRPPPLSPQPSGLLCVTAAAAILSVNASLTHDGGGAGGGGRGVFVDIRALFCVKRGHN